MLTPTAHATCVAIRCSTGWRGVLLRGPSGVGKSDLALRLIAQGAKLVADDRTILWASAGNLFARAPTNISGLLEVRSVGLQSFSILHSCRVFQVIDLAHSGIERLPDPQTVQMEGVCVPLTSIDPRPASAATVVALSLEAL